MDFITGDRIHCLELAAGDDVVSRYLVSPLGLAIGRTVPADIILSDSEVSRSHCRIALEGDELIVSDLDSTNGTFIDGNRISGMALLPVGSVLQIGRQTLKHEWRTRSEIVHANEVDRELQRAASYVRALLPPPMREGPVRAEWFYQPSAKLGGDAFGYGKLSDDLYVCYLIDVAGHGAGSAMHAVAIMNQLRQRSLPDADMTRPESVLTALNDMFQMDQHDGLYFTIWYGVYHAGTRRLDFASGGHHPAYLIPAGRESIVPLRTRNLIIGAMPSVKFVGGSVSVPEGASFYLFSDGVYEIVDSNGREWSIEDFVALVLAKPASDISEAERLYRAVCSQAQSGNLDDDFSLVVVNFE